MTIKEIAQLAGVSSAAVSRYLNGGYVSEEKKEQIRKVIEETGYQPSAQARMLRTKKASLVGVVVPKINSESISRMLDGTVDLALVGQNTRDESCVFIPFCHDELVIATPVTDHYLALKDRETPAIFHDFLKDPIIFREKGSGTKKEMDLFLERTGITTGNLNVIARMNDLESIKKSIVNGLGISILSSRSVNDLQRTKQILVFPLEEAAHKRSFYIVYSKNRILKPHVKQFVQFVRDYYM